jgi:dolichol-phosphate mannosyltransferase
MKTCSEQSSHRPPLDQAMISVVLPAYNEAAILESLYARVASVLDACSARSEIIFVNDGSNDESAGILDRMAARDRRLRVLHFSRNFGHQAAVQAGLLHARGDAVIVMDSDMQDDPAAIAEFLNRWQQGFDVVYAVRFGRKESRIKRSLFYAFYRVLNAISRTKMPMDAGNFGLLDRAVVDELVQINDRDRYFPGLRSWVGFRQIGVPVERAARHDDRARVSMVGLFRLAKTAIFSFSTVPLSMFYLIAFLSILVCGGVATYALYYKLFTTLAVPGWASVTIVSSFFGAMNALGIGILGEYAVRIYDQVRARPSHIVARRVNFSLPPVPTRDDQVLDWLAENWRTGTPFDEDPARAADSPLASP